MESLQQSSTLTGEEGADVDAADAEGFTALHRSVARGHRESMALLVAAGSSLRQGDREGGAAES